jgi:hypothetical protein
MDLQSPHAWLPLPHHRPQRLDHARGLLLRARRGMVWITIDGDLRDIVLAPGEQWVVDSSQPLVVSSLGASALVELCDAALHRRRNRRTFWRQIVEGLWNPLSRDGPAMVRGEPA